MPDREIVVSIDRVERTVAMVVADDDRAFHVPVARFKATPREGRIYRVPLDGSGDPQWEKAVADDAEMKRRRKSAGARMRRLQGKDPGGDIDL